MAAHTPETGGVLTGTAAAGGTGEVLVKTQLGAACVSCSSKCGARRSPRITTVLARADAPLAAGRRVVLAPHEGAVAQISLLLYLLPATGFLVGALLGHTGGQGDLVQGLLGLVGLGIGLLASRRVLALRFSAGAPISALQSSEN